MDWTSFARDQQDTVVLSMLTGHGRATPLMWRTVESSSLKGQMKRHEKEVLERLREGVAAGVKVTVVADRGFGDCKLFKTLTQESGFEYVRRIHRTHSLFRQGLMRYDHIPDWPDERVQPLMEKFSQMLMEQRVFKEIFGVIR